MVPRPIASELNSFCRPDLNDINKIRHQVGPQVTRASGSVLFDHGMEYEERCDLVN